MNEAEPTFLIGYKQLTPDAKKAGLSFPDAERAEVPGKELRALLRSAEALAPKVSYPLAPELRITAPSGRYVVQLKDGRLHFVSWSSAKSRGGNPTADQIFAIITGEELEDDTTPVAAAGPADEKKSSGTKTYVISGVLAAVIMGSNLYSFWNYKKAPGNLLPAHSIVEPEPARRLLDRTWGNYETGGNPGDRRLEIGRDGKVIWVKFGVGRSIVEKKEFTVQGAKSGGQDALLTSRKSLIKVKDATSLVLFGDTYLRVVK